ncbi:MAG: 4Fe-4S dicluster domain-containing protein [Spirochaetes bacterium]|nr:4Fe-4S dicluster domain-containing protein [Spirochaetota bacterium]
MINVLKVRKSQGYQAIPDIRAAKIRKPFRGLPVIGKESCKKCSGCLSVCPAMAISTDPLSIDMGKCIFCGDCETACPEKVITFTQFHKISTDDRNKLIIRKGTTADSFYSSAISVRKEINRLFGKSLKLRLVSAGGCNGCEWELNASGNVNFDMGRFGIDIVASPRHADGIIITGPVTKNMAAALDDAYHSTPDPKVVILAGSCAISAGIFQDSLEINRSFLDKYHIDLYIPGCPVHPLTVINGLLDFLRK